MFKLILFDLDETLAESKQPITQEVANMLTSLLEKYHVGVISGGSYKQFEIQFLSGFKESRPELLDKLVLLPTCGTQMIMHEQGKQEVKYREVIPEEERSKIKQAYAKMMEEFTHQPEKTWGDIVEDRETQITFSAYGQHAPPDEKKKWDPQKQKRIPMMDFLQKHLGDAYEVRIGGSTSIDITKKGIDKAYGVKKIEEVLGIGKEDIIFFGDALESGGNDHPVLTTGVPCVWINSHEEVVEKVQNVLRPT